VHKPGKDNVRADVLSRWSDHKVSDRDDDQDVVVLRPELFVHCVAATGSAEIAPDSALTDWIWKGVVCEAGVLSGLPELAKNGPKQLSNGLPEWGEGWSYALPREALYPSQQGASPSYPCGMS
jgi:hypothetical protein